MPVALFISCLSSEVVDITSLNAKPSPKVVTNVNVIKVLFFIFVRLSVYAVPFHAECQ
jgi:hypothetical protein